MKREAIKLPLKCTAEYVEDFLSKEESKRLYTELLEEYGIANFKTEITVGDKVSLTDTGKIMFIDEELFLGNKFPASYWGKTEIWSDKLRKIKERVEDFAGIDFNVCVCIYYPDGNAGVDYHSDYIAYGDTTVIPSLSLGEERIFHLREKENFEIFETVLQEGSMLVMGENCQQNYEHSLPVNPKYKKGRINLTFRQYGFRNTAS